MAAVLFCLLFGSPCILSVVQIDSIKWIIVDTSDNIPPRNKKSSREKAFRRFI
jgi:hypothetical protein